MMKLMHSCCYYEDGKFQYIFSCIGSQGEDDLANIHIPNWSGLNIFCNGSDYSSAGDPTKGIPAQEDTNFYAAYGT